jgi:hypothetical protein
MPGICPCDNDHCQVVAGFMRCCQSPFMVRAAMRLLGRNSCSRHLLTQLLSPLSGYADHGCWVIGAECEAVMLTCAIPYFLSQLDEWPELDSRARTYQKTSMRFDEARHSSSGTRFARRDCRSCTRQAYRHLSAHATVTSGQMFVFEYPVDPACVDCLVLCHLAAAWAMAGRACQQQGLQSGD